MQAGARMRAARKAYTLAYAAVVRTQAGARRFIAATRYRAMRAAVLPLQSSARAKPPRLVLSKALRSAVLAQAGSRRKLAVLERHRLVKQREEAARQIQRLQRGRVARTRVEKIRTLLAVVKQADADAKAAHKEAEEVRMARLHAQVAPKLPPPAVAPLRSLNASLSASSLHPLERSSSRSELDQKLTDPLEAYLAQGTPAAAAISAEAHRKIDPLAVYLAQGSTRRGAGRRRPPPRAAPNFDLAGLDPAATVAALQAESDAAYAQSQTLEARYDLAGSPVKPQLAAMLATKPYKGKAVHDINSHAKRTLIKTMDNGAIGAMQALLDMASKPRPAGKYHPPPM